VGYVNDGKQISIFRLSDLASVSFTASKSIGAFVVDPLLARTLYFADSISVNELDMGLLKNVKTLNVSNLVESSEWSTPAAGVISSYSVGYWGTLTINLDIYRRWSYFVVRVADMEIVDSIKLFGDGYSFSTWHIEVDAASENLYVFTGNYLCKVTGTACVRVFPPWLWGVIVFVSSFVILGIVGGIMRKIVIMNMEIEKLENKDVMKPLLSEEKNESPT